MKTLTMTVDSRSKIGAAIINQFTKHGLYTRRVKVGDDCVSYVQCCFIRISTMERQKAEIARTLTQAMRVAEAIFVKHETLKPEVEHKVGAPTSDTAMSWVEWVESYDGAKRGEEGTIILHVADGKHVNPKLADLIAEYDND